MDTQVIDSLQPHRLNHASCLPVASSSSEGGGRLMEKTCMTDHPISADQNIPDWLIKMTFREKMEAAIKANIPVVFSLTAFTLLHCLLFSYYTTNIFLLY